MTISKLPETNELFKGKPLPPCIANHEIFTKPGITNRKIFPKIGLPNFKQETDIARSNDDIRKEGSYVFNLLRDMHAEMNKAKVLVQMSTQKTQFLESAEVRLARKNNINEVVAIVKALTIFVESCDPHLAITFHPTTGCVSSAGGKIDFRLPKDIGPAEKPLYRKGMRLFKLYGELRNRCLEQGVDANNVSPLEALVSHQVFGVENIPNKKYHIVFSSTGEIGAWDIITMGMRGTRSCQRWAGEYTRCLVGSVLSKFVGIIYLTSGANAEVPTAEDAQWGSLGTKMMKRCVVRYAYDKEAGTPCLILDKMYMTPDEEVLKAFIDALSSRAKYTDSAGNKKPIPVYSGAALGNRAKHIYTHNENILDLISHRERSYQDTPLRSRRDIDAHMLAHKQQESAKMVEKIGNDLSYFISDRFSSIANSYAATPEITEIKRIVVNISLSIPFTQMAETIVHHLMSTLPQVQPIDTYDSKTIYRNHLRLLLKNRESMVFYNKTRIQDFLRQNSSGTYRLEIFCNHLSKLIAEFVKKEIAVISKSFSI